MKRRRPALFCAQIVDYGGNKRRMTQTEIRECWRLWCRHADIRAGRVKA